MRIGSDSFYEIIDTITRNKARSILTGFGLFWGVFMLILLSGGGEGLKHYVAQQLSGLSTNAAAVFVGRTSMPYDGFEKGRSVEFTPADMRIISTLVPEIEKITPLYTESGKLQKDSYSFSGNMKGVAVGYKDFDVPLMSYGRYINELDQEHHRKVCVIGINVYKELFPEGGDPCGKSISMNDVYYTVIGVNASESGNANINGRTSDSIFVPETTFRAIHTTGDNSNFLIFLARDGVEIGPVIKQVESIMRKNHHISPDDEDVMFTIDTQSVYKLTESITSGLGFLIWLVGIGTILAGAIGVSNIMMVSVRERTTEIGIRRAIGATPKMILSQVIAESVLLTLVSGLSGIVVAVWILNTMDLGMSAMAGGISFQVSFSLAFGAAVMLAVFGVLAGLAPAIRAMNIKPVEAMHEE